jgi:hypothetical protein
MTSRTARPLRIVVGAALALITSAELPSGCGGSSDDAPNEGGASGTKTCDSIQDDYARGIDEAQSCDPTAQGNPCTVPILVGLVCACTEFANPEHADAIERTAHAQDAYREQGCSSAVQCGACYPATAGRCSADGRCENVTASSGRGCKVNGALFEDGDGGIQDPTSCNTCTCRDGGLACTEIYCPVPCPEGTAPGQQCAACGPTDACEIVEHGCLPTCTDGCETGTCLDGLCLTGICG